MVDPFSQSYRCVQNAPLRCDRPLKTAKDVPNAKFCLECGFPATLADKAEIRGDRGVYRVVGFVRSQGMGRLYKGIQVSDGKPVVIKEYLLPSRCFNAEEAQQRKAIFTRIAGASSLNSEAQDFRLVAPWEAIADSQGDRCYLITQGKVAAEPNLSQVLRQSGAMSAEQVRNLLGQVLQTLQFLHNQKFRLPSGQVRPGMAHGNLSLESLIVSENFYIYSCDLASWERIFDPPPSAFTIPDPAQDLVALGHIAFYLWLGRAVDATSGRPPDPRDLRLWPTTDPALREFLYHLIGLETAFSSAEAARQALLQLPSVGDGTSPTRETQTKEPQKRQQYLWLLLLPILLLLGGGLFWLVWSRFAPPDEAEEAAFNRLLPSFTDVNTIEAGNYDYTAAKDSTWTTVLGKRPVSDRQLNEIFSRPRPNITASFKYRPQLNPITAVDENNGQANFAISSLVNQLPNSLKYEQIAYDGLLVFVPAYKARNLPAALQGQISLNDLQKIFTRQVDNWQDLNPQLPDLPIKPYRPLEPEALRLFEQIVLNNDPELVAKFNQVDRRSTFEILRAINLDEQQGQQLEAGTISFGTLVQTWDQCKVYPLALVNGQAQPVQALLRETTDGRLVPITPNDSLCLEKKPIPNVQAYINGAYPLRFPLAIAYPNDNSLPGFRSGPMFADLLKTRDGQYLLQQTGLVPLQPIPREYKPSESLLNF